MSHTDDCRVVTDYSSAPFDYKYRGQVREATSAFRRRPGYKGLIERHFMGWTHDTESGWFPTKEQARAWCENFLDAIDYKNREGECV